MILPNAVALLVAAPLRCDARPCRRRRRVSGLGGTVALFYVKTPSGSGTIVLLAIGIFLGGFAGTLLRDAVRRCRYPPPRCTSTSTAPPAAMLRCAHEATSWTRTWLTGTRRTASTTTSTPTTSTTTKEDYDEHGRQNTTTNTDDEHLTTNTDAEAWE